jgi:N utilization substance protein B
MISSREVRKCALQALYQFDAGNTDEAAVRCSLEEAPGTPETHDRGYELATNAWKHKQEADSILASYAEEWPTHRQPVVDRSLLRLAYYEMVHGETPPKVAINEAVELAKEFSTEKSAAFINGILDKIYKTMRVAQTDEEEGLGPWALGLGQEEEVDAVPDTPATKAQGPMPEAHDEGA